jgi:MFS family permease
VTPALQRLRDRVGVTDDTAFDRTLIAPMILGSILNPVNSSLIAVALVPIGLALGAPPAETSWLVSGLYLATAIGQPVAGRLVDLYGPRAVFLAGAALIAVGGVLGLLAPTIGLLVAARVLIGLGTCAGYPSAMYLIRSEADRTGRDSPATILTVLAVSTQTVAVVGPTLGGLLIAVGGWRATFAVNVPLALACLVLGRLRLPHEDSTRAERREHRTSLASAIDAAGIALFTLTLMALLLFLLHPSVRHGSLLAGAAVGAAALVGWELRAASPFLDLRVLAGNRPLLATYARALLTATVSYAVLYGFTQWLEQGRGLSAAAAGLVLLPIFGTGILVSVATGRRPEIRGKLAVGAVGQLVLSGLLLLLDERSGIWLIVVVALVAGIPQGLNNLANQNAVYHQADPARIGASAGLLRTFYYLGAILASTVSGAVFRPIADTPGLHALALVMLAAAAVFLVLTVADRSLRDVVPATEH